MHGSKPFASPLVGLVIVVLAGCDEARPHPTVEEGRTPAAALAFDPRSAGAIEGRVTWDGALPIARPLSGWVPLPGEEFAYRKLERANPNAPQIDPLSRGLKEAVVFLRGIAPARGRPWDHPPVLVEQNDYRLLVHQGEGVSRQGFVRRGDTVTMVSTQGVFHALHARGAAFFALPFPDPDQPARRRLERTGLVELSSGAGCFWMRAYLFVDEHPYYAATDAEGRFALLQVPPGRCELVCWVPSWLEAGRERDPETSLVTRLRFRHPVELVQTVTVRPRESCTAHFTVREQDFP